VESRYEVLREDSLKKCAIDLLCTVVEGDWDDIFEKKLI
jgi:hypothetical protein